MISFHSWYLLERILRRLSMHLVFWFWFVREFVKYFTVLVLESSIESPIKQYSIQNIKSCFVRNNTHLIPLTEAKVCYVPETKSPISYPNATTMIDALINIHSNKHFVTFILVVFCRMKKLSVECMNKKRKLFIVILVVIKTLLHYN